MRYIYGNWKMAQSLEAGLQFVKSWNFSHPKVEVAVFPSYPHLKSLQDLNASSLKIGAQDCSAEKSGAFTGEVSAEMLKELGIKLVLIGHSEKRQRAYETNESLSKKLGQALSANLEVTFCVGETREEREAGKVFEVLAHQIKPLISLQAKVLVAYEPVWAIGTGLVPTLNDIELVHQFLAKELPFTKGILYGGSVKPENAAEILKVPYVQGLLIGGASLKLESLKACAESAMQN